MSALDASDSFDNSPITQKARHKTMADNNPRRQGRHLPSRERDAPSDVEPLEVRKLARIWWQLPEADRLPFLVALDERIGDKLLEATTPRALDTVLDP
jgi:hypothetical protein